MKMTIIEQAARRFGLVMTRRQKVSKLTENLFAYGAAILYYLAPDSRSFIFRSLLPLDDRANCGS
ncbi:hypothetical protein BZJ19_04075 [Salinivibrio proteolyticus]|nr:hypothetical protein BZJ19_04075 [Salinivibrio proteolyticus]